MKTIISWFIIISLAYGDVHSFMAKGLVLVEVTHKWLPGVTECRSNLLNRSLPFLFKLICSLVPLVSKEQMSPFVSIQISIKAVRFEVCASKADQLCGFSRRNHKHLLILKDLKCERSSLLGTNRPHVLVPWEPEGMVALLK